MDNPFDPGNLAVVLSVVFTIVLLAILIVSFRSRAVVFCQYLKAMAGIELRPSEVRRVFADRGQNGVREMFLDLIIKEDLKQGPLEVPESHTREEAELQAMGSE